MSTPVFHGPCSLTEALTLAAEQDGVRLALSVPYGAWIAVQVNGASPLLRRVARQSGQGGSEAGSGEWRDEEPGAVAWRPG